MNRFLLNKVMRYFLNYNIYINLMLFFLLSSCEVTDIDIPSPEVEKEKIVKLELFTRTDSYSLPSLRGLANESGVATTPWIIVFKKNTVGNFIFEEAVQVVEISGTNKRYAILKGQVAECKLLLLANPQNSFYIRGDLSLTPYEFSASNFENLLDGKTLEEVSSLLQTGSLNNPQESIPYSDSDLLPMSYLLDLPGGINGDTKIGSTNSPLELRRITGKIIIKNNASNFTFNGITAVVNAPENGLLHRISTVDPPDNENQGLVEYKSNDNYASDISVSVSGSTEGNPIYLYESKSGTNKDTYIIVRGQYKQKEYFYKMALVDSDQQLLDILRNHLYTLTIISIRGIGFNTVADAKASVASNTNLDFRITVEDDISHEITSNNDYYLGLTNTVFIAYSDETQVYTVTTIATDCDIDFPDYRKMSLEGNWGYDYFTLIGSDKIPIVTETSSNPAITDIEVSISNLLNHPWGYVEFQLGNLEKKVTLKLGEAVSAEGEVLKIGSPGANDQNEWPYYYVSGYVVEDTAKDWIKLVSSTGEIRNDSDNITVDDGVIDVRVLENTTTEKRRGIVFLSAIRNPGWDPENGNPTSFRIKLDITQKGQTDN